MSSDDGTYVLPGNCIVVHTRVVPFRGRLVFESARGLGPVLTSDTRCSTTTTATPQTLTEEK